MAKKKQKKVNTKADPPSPQVLEDPAELQTFSSHMTRGNKKLLQFIKVTEGRHQFEIVADALRAYAREHHPDLLKKYG